MGVALVVSTAPPAAADEPETIGIAVAVKVNVSDIEARLLSDSLGKALAEKFDVAVVAGEDAEKKLPAEGLPETCIAESECLARTASALGADRLLLLVAVRVGEQVEVDATLYDARDGSSTTRPAVKMTARERAWKQDFLEAAEALLPGAAPRPVKEPTPPVESPEVKDGTQGGPGGNTDIVATPPPRDASGGRSWGRVGLYGGIAVAAAAGTTILWLKADSVNSDCLDDPATDCGRGEWLRYSIPGDVLAAVAAGSLGFAVYQLVRGGGGDGGGRSEGAVTLGAGPGDLGLALGGHF